MTKADLGQKISEKDVQNALHCTEVVAISAIQREGLEQLEQKLADKLLEDLGGGEGEQVTRERHRCALECALSSLEKSKVAFENRKSLELVILDLKEALDQMRELVGEIYSEDLLDVVFSEFCIGK